MALRKHIDLGGPWHYTPKAWTVMNGLNSFVEIDRDLPPAGTMHIPCNWELGGLSNFHGRVMFQRDVEAPDVGPGQRVYLCFDGVDYFCRVFLNGCEVGSHEGYFQPFEFDVTDALKAGHNRLEVEVHCPNEEPETLWPDKKRLIKGVFSHWDCRPGGWDLEQGQAHNSGGIWNRVYLEVRPTVHIASVRVSSFLLPDKDDAAGIDVDSTRGRSTWPEPAETADAKVVVRVAVPGAVPGRHRVTVTIGDYEQSEYVEVGSASDEVTVYVTVPEAKLWWTWDLGEPHLYRCSVHLFEDDELIDEQTLSIGIREVHVDPDSGLWRLNGRHLFIRGTNIVPALWLSEYNDEKIARDMALLKGAHVNAVRVCVHVNRKSFYKACDEAGVLVWQDFPLQWSYAEDDVFVAEAARQVRDMIRAFYNHPSIALWTMQNESSFHNKNVLNPLLARVAMEEDSSRYVRPTSLYREHAYPGWYRGEVHQYALLPGAPLLTEFGAQALPAAEEVRRMKGGDVWPPDFDGLAYHNFQFDPTFHVAKIALGDDLETFVDNSQQYQAALIKYAVENYRRHKYEKIGCMFQFMFVDCWPAITWSVVSYDRQPKRGYDALQTAYQPVLIGADVERDTVMQGTDKGGLMRPLHMPLWVVNDLHRSFPGAEYRVTLVRPEKTVDLKRGVVDIPADSVTGIGAVYEDVRSVTPSGQWQVHLELCHEGELISRNTYEVTLVSPLAS